MVAYYVPPNIVNIMHELDLDPYKLCLNIYSTLSLQNLPNQINRTKQRNLSTYKTETPKSKTAQNAQKSLKSLIPL